MSWFAYQGRPDEVSKHRETIPDAPGLLPKLLPREKETGQWLTLKTGGSSKGLDGKLQQTARHGKGLRWRARYIDGRSPRARSFARKIDAERFLEHLLTRRCLVYGCKHSAVTEEPVLLCNDHLDLVITQATKKRPSVHDPIVYFIQNGTRVKIGWTTNLRGRLASLALPMSSVILKLDGGPGREAALHIRFAEARIKGSEWFAMTPEIERFIRREQEAAEVAKAS